MASTSITTATAPVIRPQKVRISPAEKVKRNKETAAEKESIRAKNAIIVVGVQRARAAEAEEKRKMDRSG